MKTLFLLIPSLALLFAYSTTIIAPSIKIPTDKIRENRTTTFIVTSKKDKMIIDKKRKGIEILTKIEDLKPIKNEVIIKTIIVASITLFSKSLTCVMIFSDSSEKKFILINSGIFFVLSLTTDLILLITSIIFSPVLLETSRIIAFSPLFLANPTFSLNESLTSATSSSLIKELLFDFIEYLINLLCFLLDLELEH